MAALVFVPIPNDCTWETEPRFDGDKLCSPQGQGNLDIDITMGGDGKSPKRPIINFGFHCCIDYDKVEENNAILPISKINYKTALVLYIRPPRQLGTTEVCSCSGRETVRTVSEVVVYKLVPSLPVVRRMGPKWQVYVTYLYLFCFLRRSHRSEDTRR